MQQRAKCEASAATDLLNCCSGGARVALKIIKNVDRYREAAMSEIDVLRQMNSLDREEH